MDGRMTITDVAKLLGVTPRTLMRWEKSGKIKKSKRDWRGWRFYHKEDIEGIKRFYESAYEYADFEGSIADTVKSIVKVIIIGLILSSSILLYTGAVANPDEAVSATGIKETAQSVDIVLEELPAVQAPQAPLTYAEDVKYTLGPNDVIAIEVRRHPEFSDQYPVNSEGKIEYKYIGDIIVAGLTKNELKQRLSEILSEYIVEPEIDIQIIAYLSKVFYVVGEVHRPGKFYMRGDTVTVREALVQAGLPTYAAAMRRSRLITPEEAKKNNYVSVDVYSLLYEGNLEQNLTMQPGNVLYVPATAIAKMLRVISPATDAAGAAGQTVGMGAAAVGAF